ncbi:hypothetical protein [Actinomadura sp. NPDC048394]|uniref:hypothetical protein n=1 Tax=Actinomadura sp. NPDC048394 TaxID=3158223 RepID=UPI0033E740C4
MSLKSVMRPEGSLILGATVAGMVYATYQLDVGPVSGAQATDANHPVLESSRKKAGYTSLIMVGGLALLAKDPNIVILGGAAVIAMEAHYRHAIMAHPETGQMQPPSPDAYQPAQNVVPLAMQAQTG